MFFCVFCVFGSYSGNLCLYMSWKSTNFALDFNKRDYETFCNTYFCDKHNDPYGTNTD